MSSGSHIIALLSKHWWLNSSQRRIQDFKLGGTALTKLRRAEGGENIFGVFRVKKITILGGAPGATPPPLLHPPLVQHLLCSLLSSELNLRFLRLCLCQVISLVVIL